MRIYVYSCMHCILFSSIALCCVVSISARLSILTHFLHKQRTKMGNWRWVLNPEKTPDPPNSLHIIFCSSALTLLHIFIYFRALYYFHYQSQTQSSWTKWFSPHGNHKQLSLVLFSINSSPSFYFLQISLLLLENWKAEFERKKSSHIILQ